MRVIVFAAAMIVGGISAAPVSTTSCTGESAKLPDAECTAWLSIYDHFQLGESQNRGCGGGRTDPW